MRHLFFLSIQTFVLSVSASWLMLTDNDEKRSTNECGESPQALVCFFLASAAVSLTALFLPVCVLCCKSRDSARPFEGNAGNTSASVAECRRDAPQVSPHRWRRGVTGVF